MTGKTIYIDNRERSGLEKLVMRHAAKAKITCEVQENMLSDYSFGEVGIEAKTMEDFFQSLHSGHLARQLDNMDDNLSRYALVIHGTLDKYVAGIKRRGRQTPYSAIEAQFIGALARFDVDYDFTEGGLSDRAAPAPCVGPHLRMCASMPCGPSGVVKRRLRPCSPCSGALLKSARRPRRN